jgi:hypothetical protein
MNKFYLSKETIALVVVFFDIVIGLVLFATFMYLHAMQNITVFEINELTVTA